MDIKIILFPNNLTLIAQIEEIDPEDIGQPDCKIIEPFSINGDFLEPWLIDVSTQNAFMMHSDKFLTIVEPNQPLLAKYKELIK
jgi:hypothetical protein